jgi:hypothetical protein
MRLIDAQFLEAPWYGARHWRLMVKMGLARFGWSEIVNTDSKCAPASCSWAA